MKGSNDTVLDQVVSLYSLSIKALVHRQQQRIIKARDPKRQNTLLVTMQDTPSRFQLLFVSNKLDILEDLCPLLNLRPICP